MKNSKLSKHPGKREQVIRTAEQLFTKFGSKRVTVEEICRKAGARKMTFYKYFSNKVDLVRGIRDEWAEEGFRNFDEINAMDIPYPEKINELFKEGSWNDVFSDFSQFQEQLKTLIFYGLLSRSQNSALTQTAFIKYNMAMHVNLFAVSG